MQGILGGYEVVVNDGADTYKIKVAEGVRGMNIPVSVSHNNGVWSVSLQGKPLTIVDVYKAVFKKVTPHTRAA